jgi:hypothetical protein
MKPTESQQLAIVAQREREAIAVELAGLRRDAEMLESPMPDPIDWQARAVAAELGLVTMLEQLGDIADSKAEEVRNDWTSGEAHGWNMALRHVYGLTPDLAAARELMRKAGEHDKTLAIFENSARPTPGDLMGYVTCLCDEFTRLYAKEESTQTYAVAAVERAFCDAAIGFADAKASIEAQSDEYKRTLTALQAARRQSC